MRIGTVATIVVVVAVVAIAAVVLAQEKENVEPSPVVAAAGEPPVVAAIPYKYETEYEQDPFEPDRLRRTRTVVTHVVIVRADGQTSVRSVE